MFQLDMRSHRSIYEQVIDNIKELISIGVLGVDTRLPSVRELASSLAINPNTVQKAFKELEREGYIYTVTGKGTFVSPREGLTIDRERLQNIVNLIKQNIKELYFIGLTDDEIKNLIADTTDDIFSALGDSADEVANS